MELAVLRRDVLEGISDRHRDKAPHADAAESEIDRYTAQKHHGRPLGRSKRPTVHHFRGALPL